jgi:RES domain-containing protein
VRVWRLCQAAYSREALNGEGGLRGAGRWHVRGTRIVYTSSTLSLAALELLVRVGRDDAPLELVAVEIEVPEALEIERIPLSRLSAGWDESPAPRFTQQFGTDWIASSRTAVLELPSAVIPREHNYVLNPAHRLYHRIRIAGRAPFSFDPRLLD